jgi:hypothetical protein
MHFDPEPGRRYPTLNEYDDALARLRREEAAMRAMARPVEPTAPKKKPTQTDLIEHVIRAPEPARLTFLNHQIQRGGVYHGRQASVYLPPMPEIRGWRIGLQQPDGRLLPLQDRVYPSRDFAEGAMRVIALRQPGQAFVIIDP